MSPKNKNSRKSLNPLYIWLWDLLTIWTACTVTSEIFGMDFYRMPTRILILLGTISYIPAAMYIRQGRKIVSAVTLDKVFANSLKAIVIQGLVFLALSAFIHIIYSITFYVTLFAIQSVLFITVNLLLNRWVKRVRKKGRYTKRVAIVGINDTAERLSKSMMKDAGYGYRIVGNYDNEQREGFGSKYLGDIDTLEQDVEDGAIDEIFFTAHDPDGTLMTRVAGIADRNMVSFFFVPKISRYVHSGFHLHNISSVPVLSLRPNPLTNVWRRGLKRTFDIVFSSLFLMVSPIVFIPVAIAIKASSPGPVFFRQERTGYKGKSFKCFKFRTMRVNSDADSRQATQDDPRKTRVGSFLRRTNLDELPQFINVWLGNMSVVGPRPHMLKHTEEYSALIGPYMVRHTVKPGITGWAQVNGFRGITDQLWKMERRIECDVWYIENWTLSLDLKIVARTIVNAIKGEKNAF